MRKSGKSKTQYTLLHSVRARVYKAYREQATVYFPNYWSTMPMAVFTFLEHFDFTGKTICPFCTHEGSGMGSSEADIRRLCPAAKLKKGLAIRGGSAGSAEPEIRRWLK